MALCKLTSTHPGNAPLYINPLHVVGVYKSGTTTLVATIGHNAVDRGLNTWPVAESLEDAVQLLDASLPRLSITLPIVRSAT